MRPLASFGGNVHSYLESDNTLVNKHGKSSTKPTVDLAFGVPGKPKLDPVAEIAAFLASDNSTLINGTEVYADGGTHGCTYGP